MCRIGHVVGHARLLPVPSLSRRTQTVGTMYALALLVALASNTVIASEPASGEATS